MDLGIINNEIRRSSLKGSSHFLYTYLDYEEQIINALKHEQGIKTELYLKEINPQLESLIRFSAIFSDVTIINNTTSSIKDSHITYFDQNSKYYKERQFTFPESELQNFNPKYIDVLPCYIHRSDTEVKRIAKDFKPLLNSNRLLVRPLRCIYAHNKITKEKILHYANPNTDNEHWLVDNINNKEYFFIDNGLSFEQIMQLFELTVPYFEGIKLETLDKVLTDEMDLLSVFRSSVKKVIREGLKNFSSINELRQDIVQPEIDKINRRFKKISSIHNKAIAGSIGTFALSSFLGIHQGAEIMKLLSLIPAAAIIATRLKLDDDTDKLKDNSYYLLWKINLKK